MAWFKRLDFVLLAAVVLLALGWLLIRQAWPAQESAVLAVILDGETTRYSLEEDREIWLRGEEGENLLRIENGEAYIVSADCAGGECMAMGRISKPGQSILCLPHRLVITVEGQGGVDAVVS